MNNAETETRALQLAADQPETPRNATSTTALVMDADSMDKMFRMAEIMASGRSTIPKHLQGNTGDCMAIVMQSIQWRMNPYAVAQKTHTVNGTLGYEAQLVAAVINTSGLVKDRFNFEWFGDWTKVIGKFIEKESKKNPGEKYRVLASTAKDEEGLGVRVWATLNGEAAPRTLELLLIQAGVRNSPLWADDPKQQLAYLAQKRWARLHAPDVILGVYTPDEFDAPAPRDMGPAVPDLPDVPGDLLKTAHESAGKGVAAYQEFWKAAGATNRKLLASEHEGLKAKAIDADKNRTVDNAPTDSSPSSSPTPAGAPPSVTYAEVQEAIAKAGDVDALNVAADLIASVANPDEQDELRVEYRRLLEKFQGNAS